MTTEAGATCQSSIALADKFAAVKQLAHLISVALSREVTVAFDGRTFSTDSAATETGAEIVSVHGELRDDSVQIAFELVRTADKFLTDTAVLSSLALLKRHKAFLIHPEELEGVIPESFWAGIQVKARPLDYERAQQVTGTVKYLHQVAKDLQQDLPRPLAATELETALKDVKDVKEVQPVHPWPAALPSPSILKDWATEINEYLRCGLSVANVADTALHADIAHAVLSEAARASGRILAKLSVSLSMKLLPEFIRNLPAPSVLLVPAANLTLATNRYDLGTDAQVALNELQASGLSVVFSGDYDQLQRALSGGPGAKGNPTHPLIKRIPEVESETAARYALEREVTAERLPARFTTTTLDRLLRSIADLSPDEQLRVLPAAARRCLIEAVSSTPRCHFDSPAAFVRANAAARETFGSLEAAPASSRRSHIQKTYQRLADPGLPEHLQEHLIAQQRAIREVCDRLQAEALCRPLDQPLRLLLLATPGVGKSRCCQLIAEHLGIRYEQLNIGGQTGEHSAQAQVMGAAPGLVGSDKPGIFEKIAKTAEERGILLEVADLDHASPNVRSVLSNLFLGPLDQGMIQNAAGDRIPCASMLLIFTMNLPGNADERLNRSMGFVDQSYSDIRERALEEIRDATSNAFLSRMGTPVYFDALSTSALGEILEAAIRDAVLLATDRLGIRVGRLVCAPETGAELIAYHAPRGITTLGARGIQELGRSLASAATAALLHTRYPQDARIQVDLSPGEEGRLCVSCKPMNSNREEGKP